MLKRAVGLIVLALVAAALLVYSQYRREPPRVTGFVEADEIRIGSRVGGRVAAVRVEEGDRVSQGQTLIELEPFDLYQRRAQAQFELAARQAEYERLASGFREEEIEQARAQRNRLAAVVEKLETGPRKQEIAAAQARVQLAQAELELAQSNLNRVQRLRERNAATAEELDDATTALRVAQANDQVRKEELALLLEGTRAEEIMEAKAQLEEARQGMLLRERGYRREEVAQAQAAVEAAQAALLAIEKQIDELNIVAPLDAVVEALELRPGDLVAPNAPVLSLMDVGRLWVRAYVPERLLGVEIGQPVEVSVDSFPDERFAGRISFISRQAEFTPANVQTPEERAKQVFRIKVTLEEGLERLRPGMSADVWLKDAR